MHRAPRRSATVISKVKTTPGSLSSLHSLISTAEEDDRALAAARQFGVFKSRFPRRRSSCTQQPAILEETLVIADPKALGVIKFSYADEVLRTHISYHICPLGADFTVAAHISFPAHRHSVVAAHQRVATERHDNMDLGP